MFKIFDNLLYFVFRVDHQDEQEFYQIRNRIRESNEEVELILHDMSAIDSKSSALLTHISIMFAVIAYLLVQEGNASIVSIVLITEFVFYLIIAMFLMRCIEIMGPPFRKTPNNIEEFEKIYFLEMNLRRKIYHISLRFICVLTALLIPIAIMKYQACGDSPSLRSPPASRQHPNDNTLNFCLSKYPQKKTI